MGLLDDGGIRAVPGSCVAISCGRHHDGSHYAGDVESRPLRHEHVEQYLLAHSHISPLLQFILHWHSSRIVDRVRLVTIIVGLHKEPS